MRGVDAEEKTDAGGDEQTDQNRPEFNLRGEGDDQGNDFGQADAGDYADHASRQGHGCGLDEKLKQNIIAACAQRLAHADLPGAFGDGNQHDVHDDNAANDQRDACDGHHHGSKAIEDSAQEVLEGGAGVDGEAVGGAGGQVAARAHENAQLIGNRIHYLATSTGIDIDGHAVVCC